jgi:P27 family predicted phage terminase small subunit
MAKPGRKPKPTVDKVLAGVRADRVNRSEPRPSRSTPECPDHLDAAGREAWARIVPKLDALGVLTEMDGEALALYCGAYSRWRKATEEIRTGGVTTFTGQGSLKSNPAVAVASQCERLMAAILIEFGLTPSSRSRVKTDAKPQDALADFLSRRKG